MKRGMGNREPASRDLYRMGKKLEKRGFAAQAVKRHSVGGGCSYLSGKSPVNVGSAALVSRDAWKLPFAGVLVSRLQGTKMPCRCRSCIVSEE